MLDAEEAVGWRERVYWALMGLGCTWFLNDSMFLQLPYWISSQPEGLVLGSRIATTGSIVPPVMAFAALTLRKHHYKTVNRVAVPTLIGLSLFAGTILAVGLWRLSSNFIYLSMALASTVGGLSSFITTPWVMGSGFKPACISPMFFGGSVGSLSAATLAMFQSPGKQRNFSPSTFFLLATLPIVSSIYAYRQIISHGVGKKGTTKVTKMLGDYLAPSFDTAIGVRHGEIVTVLDASLHDEWLLVQNEKGKIGFVPRCGVAGYSDAEIGPIIEACDAAMDPSAHDAALSSELTAELQASGEGPLSKARKNVRKEDKNPTSFACLWFLRTLLFCASTHLFPCQAFPVAKRTGCGTHIVPRKWDAWLPQNWRQWIGSIWLLALWMAIIAMCTWTVSRAVMGFATTHTVVGHHRCHDDPAGDNGLAGCNKLCSQYEAPTVLTGANVDRELGHNQVCSKLCKDEDLLCMKLCNLCTDQTVCTAGTSADGDFECRENRGEVWLQWMTALAQWAYTGGIGLTIVAPSFHLWRISALWTAAFATLLVIAMVGDGTFETKWAGPTVVGAALLVRATDGYMGIMVFRYVASKFPADAESVTVSFGIFGMVVNVFGAVVSSALVESGIIKD
eukprot:SAG31_NODE_3687_length_3987_cov_4.811214_4_plen_621_part_00